MRLAVPLALAASLLLVHSALAVDGVHEINHACATSASGCFPGDAGGYPVTIASTGSYRLTSDLLPSSAAQTAIAIEASLVNVDLNHFGIRGPWTSGGCGTGTAGVGVLASDSTIGVGVRNGSVSGMSVHGIALVGIGSRVEGVFALLNCTTGIFLGPWAHVSDSQAWRNGAHGIVVEESSIITRSIAGDNGAYGLLGNEPGVLITDSTASSNALTGIITVTGGMVARSASRENGTAGNPLQSHGIDAPLILESVSTLNVGRAMSAQAMGLSLGDGNMSGENVGCIALVIGGVPSIQCPTHP